MTSKLDLKAISDYSNAYSEKICNNFFENKDVITGSEVLNITAVDQVNMFTIKALFENWKAATEKFKSPYFDFENEKVKEALQNFMNTASQFIAVKKEDFQPLLTKATAETLALTLNPLEYFDGIFRDLPNFKCTNSDLTVLKKYNRINSEILNGISDKMGIEDSVFTNQALNWLNEVVETTNLEDKDQIISQFSSLISCEKNQFYKNKNNVESTESKSESTSFFDNISSPQPIENHIIDLKKVELIIEQKPVEVVVEKEAPSTLNETYQSGSPTVNDQLKQSDSPSLVDLHQKTPVKNLAEHISLNQKFVFINKLFNGDSAAYNETLLILENCKDTEEAISLLKYKYAPKYHWNLNSDESDELIDILKRKA